MKAVTLAITGASGAQYGLRLLECLLAAGCPVHFMISKAALLVVATETDDTLPAKPQACVSCRAFCLPARPVAGSRSGRLDGGCSLGQWCADADGGLPGQHRHALGYCLRCQQ